MYTKAVREWTTSLCTPDSESCIVTTLLPCHVYAKLNLNHYGLHFFSYALFVLCIRNIYSTLAYYHHYQCPASHIDQCVYLEKDQCESHFMVVQGVDTPCVYYDDYDACIFSQTGCIQVDPHAYTWLGTFLSLCYLCLFSMNYSARRRIRDTSSIETNHECASSTVCSTCGLAQAYREIV